VNTGSGIDAFDQERTMNETHERSSEGGCLCGKIRYRVSQPMSAIIACHCTHCQKASGSAMSHNTPIASSAFSLIAGAPKCYTDTAQSGNKLHRYFCGDCGSPIYSQRELMPEMVVLKVGTLDESNGMQHVMDIWTNSARRWVALDPAREHYPENRPIKK
jgi:hypothetical protein